MKSKFLVGVGVLAGLMGSEAHAGRTSNLSLKYLPINTIEAIVVNYVLPGQFTAFAKCSNLDDKSRDELREKWLDSGKFHIKFAVDKAFKPAREMKDDLQKEIDSGKTTLEKTLEELNSDFDIPDPDSELSSDEGELEHLVGLSFKDALALKNYVLFVALNNKKTICQLIREEVLSFTEAHGGDVKSLGNFIRDIKELRKKESQLILEFYEARESERELTDQRNEIIRSYTDFMDEFKNRPKSQEGFALAIKCCKLGACGFAAQIAHMMIFDEGSSSITWACNSLYVYNLICSLKKDYDDSRKRQLEIEEFVSNFSAELGEIDAQLSSCREKIQPYLTLDPDLDVWILTPPEYSRKSLGKLEKYPSLYFALRP